MAALRQWLNPRALTQTWSRHFGESATALTEAEASKDPQKTIYDLDGPPAWPIIGNFLTYIKKENRGRLHEVQADQHQRYGKMFREKLGPRTNLHLADPALMEQVLRNQGKHPIRSSFNSWKVYRTVTGEAFGILTSEGEEWHRIRSVLSKRMLKPKLVNEYAEEMNDVVSDMINRIRHVRNEHSENGIVQDLPNELYKWAMESIGTVLFETRMGCLQEPMPPRVQEFIDAIAEMMSSSLQIIIGEGIHQKLNTRFWRSHKEAWDRLFEIAKMYIDMRLEDITSRLQETEEMSDSQTGILTHLLSTGSMNLQEIYANMTEMMLGGVDTTSNTLCFTLYMLSQHPRVQEKLQEEVDGVLEGRQATPEDLKRMPYLKNVLKETLRLYPVVTMNVRELDKDLVLDGYLIPKQTLIVMNHYAASRDENVFEHAQDFFPERWDRQGSNKVNYFASLPFGYGTRSCVGRRFAELELYLALSRICQTFWLQPHEGFPLKTELRTLLSPGAQLPIEFVDR